MSAKKRKHDILHEGKVENEKCEYSIGGGQNDREASYDILRIVATIAVVLLHVTALPVNKMLAGEAALLWLPNFLNCVPRFAVPCFVLLSGAFLLDDDRNCDYRYFYKKSMRKLVIPTLLFTVLYFVYSEILQMINIWRSGAAISSLMLPVVNVIKGSPFYHMWYLYMLAGLYLLVPVIMNAKKNISFAGLEKVSWIILILSCISYNTSTHMLKWDIGFQVCFLGYFLMGYVIRKKQSSEKAA